MALNPGRISISNAAQSGSAMVEFTIVDPIITLLGLAMLQYGMLFIAKDRIRI